MTKLFASSSDTTYIIDVPGDFPHIFNRIDDEPFYFVRMFSKNDYDSDSAISVTRTMLEMRMDNEPFATFSFFKKNSQNIDIDNFKCQVIDSDTDIIIIVLVVPYAPNCSA